MKLTKVLGSLLLGSAISLSAGGLLLYAFDQVPLFLVDLTVGAVIVLFILAYFVFSAKKLAVNVATVLGVIAPLLSLSTPAHLAILESFGRGWLVSADGLFQALGFYVFPVTFVVLRIVYHGRLSTRNKPIAQREELGVKEKNNPGAKTLGVREAGKK